MFRKCKYCFAEIPFRQLEETDKAVHGDGSIDIYDLAIIAANFNYKHNP
jgi:hypothetical protein